MQSTRQREWIGQELKRVAQVDDEYQVALIELALQLFRFQSRSSQFFQDDAAAPKPGHKEAHNAQEEQQAGEAADPVEHLRVVLEQVAKEAPRSQQRAHPEGGANAVKK